MPLDGTTNAFKAYLGDRTAAARSWPTFQPDRGTAAKAIVRGYSWTVIPITCGATPPKPEAQAKEMGSRYLFIVAYIWLEKYFSRGDIANPAQAAGAGGDNPARDHSAALKNFKDKSKC